jgi:tetratricopeptide (TPR) repeat protein
MLSVALAVTLAAAPVKPPSSNARLTFAFVPPGAPAEDLDARMLGLVLQTRTAEVLRSTGLFNELHAKQMLSMTGAEAFKADELGSAPQRDADVAWYLGADLFLSGRLERDKDKVFTFSGSSGARAAAATRLKPVKLGPAPVAALNQAIGDIAQQIAAASNKKVAKWPELTVGTTSDEALLSYARCHYVVLRQPMGIENPVVLDPEAVTQAIGDCKKALELDPKFTAAKLALALGYAIEGSDGEATKVLAETGEQDSALYWIARFWLVTRYQSIDAGEAVLRQAIEKRPGFLLAQIYLCEELTAVGGNDKALKACEDAAAATPKGVFPLLRVGKALARSGKYDEAIKRSQEALALEPKTLKSREASLQLASRYIDAGKTNEAISILEQIANDEQARGEELLRLGWAYWLKGEVDKAFGLYSSALAKAVAPGEWRTRGRAFYDLALVEAKAGRRTQAKQMLVQSMGTGFKMKSLDASLIELAREVERAAMSRDAGVKLAKAPPLAPREVTLFQIDASGELEVGPPDKPPPPDFIKLKF